MMLSSRSAASALLLALGLPLAAQPAHALAPSPVAPQAGSYVGTGSVSPVTIPGLATGDVIDAAAGRISHLGVGLDLVLLNEDGYLLFNQEAGSFGGWQSIDVGFSVIAMALLTGESADQLVVSDGMRLYRVELYYVQSEGWEASLTPLDSSSTPWGGERLIAGHATTANDSRLVVLRDAGLECLYLEFDGSTLSLKGSFTASSGQGCFHDARLMNFSDESRDDQIALITDAGFEIVECDGSTAMFGSTSYSFRGNPSGAHLAMLPAEQTGTDRDFVLWYNDYPGLGEVIFVMNTEHFEMICTPDLGIQDMHLVDWLASDGLGHADLILARGDTQLVLVAKQTATTSLDEPVFEIDMNDTALIDLCVLPAPASGSIPAGATAIVRSGDFDGDGGADLLILEPGNRLCLLAGDGGNGAPSGFSLGTPAILDDLTGPDTLVFGVWVESTNTPYMIRASAWYQPDLASPVSSTPILAFEERAGQALMVNSWNSYSGVITDLDAIYWLVIESFDSSLEPTGAVVRLCSRDCATDDAIKAASALVYPWSNPDTASNPNCENAPSGTVPRPRPRREPLPSPPPEIPPPGCSGC